MSVTTTGGNPLVAQGNIIRVRASVLIPAFPQLNVTAPFVGKEGIRLAFEGDTTTFINTMTGAVTSAEPYVMCNVIMQLLKSQGLSALYKAQIEALATIGALTVVTDATTLPNYNLTNCAIQSVRELNFAGADASYAVTLKGIYNINSSTFNLS